MLWQLARGLPRGPIICALLLGAVPALIVAALSGCIPATPANHAPQLTALAAASTEVTPGGQTTVPATASDPDGDALTHDWEGGGGTIAGSGATVTWTATAATGLSPERARA